MAVISPKQRGGEKVKILSQYQGPGVRGQGPARYHTDQIRPKLIEIQAVPWPKSGQGGHKCCGADFGSRIKILGHLLGQSASFFEIYPFRLIQVVHGGGEGSEIKSIDR